MKHEVIESARRYVGVRFKHQGRSLHGLDCLGLLIMVAQDCHLKDAAGRALADYDYQHYTHLPDGALFLAQLQAALLRIEKEELQAGDVALFQVDGNPQHCGIISDYAHGGYGIIHAYAPARKVVEHALDEGWNKEMVALFRAH